MAGKEVDAFPDMERTKVDSSTKHSSNKHHPNKLKHRNYGKTKAERLLQMSSESIPSSEKVEHEKNDSKIKRKKMVETSPNDIKKIPGLQKIIKEQKYPIHLLQSQSLGAEKIEVEQRNTNGQGLINVELLDDNKVHRSNEIRAPRSDSSSYEDFLEFLQDIEDENKLNLSDHEQLQNEVDNLLKRKKAYETHRKRRHKRSITDFDKLDTERSKYNNRDQRAKLTKLDEFPDTESTRAEHIHIGDSIFGLQAKIRRPITDFEDISVNPEYRHGMQYGNIIKVNHFPRTERLMAPRIQDYREKKSRFSY